jgi:hypothetical protein
MDFFQSHKLWKPLLSYLLPFSRTFNCTSKTTGWFTKGWNWSQPATLTKVLLQVAHAFLYTLMDFFQSRKLCPSRCYLTFFHFPERSIALVKRLAGSPKTVIQPAYANKVLLQGSTRILIYIDGLLQRVNCAQTVAISSSIFPFSCTSKTTGWFTKGLKLIQPPHLTKCYSR